MFKHISIFLCLFLSGLVGQTTVTGTVTDEESGKKLIGANVFIKGTAMGAATDLKGLYLIPNVPGGTYEITVNYMGYESVNKNLNFF